MPEAGHCDTAPPFRLEIHGHWGLKCEPGAEALHTVRAYAQVRRNRCLSYSSWLPLPRGSEGRARDRLLHMERDQGGMHAPVLTAIERMLPQSSPQTMSSTNMATTWLVPYQPWAVGDVQATCPTGRLANFKRKGPSALSAKRSPSSGRTACRLHTSYAHQVLRPGRKPMPNCSGPSWAQMHTGGDPVANLAGPCQRTARQAFRSLRRRSVGTEAVCRRACCARSRLAVSCSALRRAAGGQRFVPWRWPPGGRGRGVKTTTKAAKSADTWRMHPPLDVNHSITHRHTARKLRRSSNRL
eukprot:365237-Chlamydomonas_euryale.AAC.6